MNMDMQELIGEMSALIVRIKSGAATQGEIEAFAAAAAELHERAVVLRYKAYEAKVFGTPAPPVQEIVSPQELPAVAEIPEPEEVKTPEIVQESTIVEESPEEVSFDLFDEPEEETEAFDLFSLDSEEDETSEGPSSHKEPVVAESAAEPAIVESPIEETPAAEEQQPEITTAEEELPAEAVSSEAPFAHAEPLAPLETPVEEKIAHEPVAEEKAPEPEKPVVQPVSAAPSGDIHPVYKRLVTDDNSLAARLMAVRLETLKGAFGFNERLQIIRELFDGSNDVFAEAIEQLDSLDSKDKARHLVSEYARRFGWDKDSDLALEFVQKVERRYA